MERKRSIIHRAPCRATGGRSLSVRRQEGKGKEKAIAFTGVFMGSKAGQGRANSLGLASLNSSRGL